MTRRSVRCYGMAPADEIVLRSMLGLIAGQTAEEWEYEETLSVSPDLGIMSVAVASGLLDRRIPQQAAPRQRVVVGPRLRDTDLSLGYPFRPRSLIELLDAASQQLKSAAPVPAVAGTGATPGRFIDQLYALSTGARGPERLLYRSPDRDLIVIHPRRWTYVAADRNAVISAGARTDISLHSDGADSRSAVGDEQPLMPLLWSIGLRCRLALLAPLQPGDSIQVKRWPDLGRLRDDPVDVRIIAQLQRAPRSAQALAAQLSLETEVVVGVFNALLLAAFAVPVVDSATASMPPPVSAPPAQVSLGLLGRIRARLGLG